jgi:hypothetical protein
VLTSAGVRVTISAEAWAISSLMPIFITAPTMG